MPSSDAPRPGRRIALLAGQSAVSVTLLAWLLRGLDEGPWPAAADAARLGTTLSLLVIVGGQILYAWRWWLLLSITA